MRIGHGYDAHRFEAGRPLVLGGVRIPNHDGLGGHSDADVLSHAVADALLGGAALGDLGTHFPDSERWRGVSSIEILRETARLIHEAGFAVGNVDVTVIAEGPKLAPFRREMIANIAAALEVDVGLVSVKFTSTDGLGALGRSEGMAASAVALLTS